MSRTVFPVSGGVDAGLCLKDAVEGLAGGKAGIEGDSLERTRVVCRVGKQENGLADTTLVDKRGERFAVNGIDGFRDQVAVDAQALRKALEVEGRIEVNLFFLKQAVYAFH